MLSIFIVICGLLAGIAFYAIVFYFYSKYDDRNRREMRAKGYDENEIDQALNIDHQGDVD